jgi:hypothetical protein
MHDTVVKTGTYLYAGTVVCDVRIVYSPIRHGSGDPVEPPVKDERRDSYYLEYGGTEHRHAFIGGGGCFDTLEEAVRHASETMEGVSWLG